MADIIRLLGSPHEQTQALLSWRANGTLDGDDLTLVDGHLQQCAECRADLEFEVALAAEVASLPLDQEHGWTALAGRLDERASPPAPVAFLRRQVPLGWLIAGQAASVAAVLALFLNVASPSSSADEYHALSAAPTAPTGNLVVIFHPEASERSLRSALTQTRARLVDGPNASGAYVLHVAPQARDQAVAQLRQSPQVLLAEPVDAGSMP